MTDFSAIKAAIELVRNGAVTKVEGNGWKVYAVGAIIRVDISTA
jgi:hypothetical protein